MPDRSTELVMLCARVPKDLRRALRQRALDCETSEQAEVIEALRRHLALPPSDGPAR